MDFSKEELNFGEELVITYITHVKDLDEVNKLLDRLIQLNTKCSSKILVEYIHLLRDKRTMYSWKTIHKKIIGLRITRPSFKLLAKIITSYAHFAIKTKNETASKDAVTVYDIMTNKFKYSINTYLFNTVLHMHMKLGHSKEFWDLILSIMVNRPKSKKRIRFNAFTYLTMMKMSFHERNYHKIKCRFYEFEKQVLGFRDEESVIRCYDFYDDMRKLMDKDQKKFEEWKKTNSLVVY